MILVYPDVHGSLMICRACWRAASTVPTKISVIGALLAFFVGKGGLLVVVLLKSLSSVPVEGARCETTNFAWSAVLVIRASIYLLP
jgi:hypothetical protein